MLNEEKSAEITEILSVAPEHQVALIQTLMDKKNSKIAALEKQIAWFKEQFKLQQQRLYGRSSESADALQVDFLFDEAQPVQQEPEVDEQEQIGAYTRKKKSCGRKLDTSKLSRERHYHDLPEAQKICTCGNPLHKIGEDISEQLEHIPEQLKVIEHVQMKYACRVCVTVKAAEKPESPIPKCMAGASLIADVIVKKYQHHLPLYRQSKLFAQQGFDIPDNTLGNWVMQGAEGLMPLRNALYQQLLKIGVLQADETPVTVLNPEKKGYMWVYHSCDKENRFIVFEFSLTRGSEVVDQRLQHYQGILQTDGYSGYNGMRQQAGVIAMGCWDHARRKFVDVIKVCGKNKTGKAGTMLSLINKLYQIEDEAKGKSFAERKQLRQEKAKPILDKVHSKLLEINALPQSALGKAVQYALNQWVYLTRYIDYGEAQISNCWAENQIRPFALGRKNWLFVGNEESASKSALLYSLIQTCLLNDIDPRRYLIYVLNQVHHMRRGEVGPVTLLPQFIDKSLLK